MAFRCLSGRICMIALRNQNPIDPTALGFLTDLQIMQQVLGGRPNYIRGWSRVIGNRGSSSSVESSGRSQFHPFLRRYVADIEVELRTAHEELATAKARIDDLQSDMRAMKSVLTIHNLLPAQTTVSDSYQTPEQHRRPCGMSFDTSEVPKNRLDRKCMQIFLELLLHEVSRAPVCCNTFVFG